MEYIDISSDDSSSKPGMNIFPWEFLFTCMGGERVTMEQEKEKEKVKEQAQEREREREEEREREGWLWLRTVLRSEESPRMFPGWRVVEVGASADPTGAGAGGAFVLRDEGGALVIARAFPVAARPAETLLRDAVALREALRAMVELGEERLLFLLPSQELRIRIAPVYTARRLGAPAAAAAAAAAQSPGAERLVLGGGAADEAEVERVVRECGEWTRRAPEFRLVHRRGRPFGPAHWMAETAALCLQNMQWDAPLLQENLSLLHPPSP